MKDFNDSKASLFLKGKMVGIMLSVSRGQRRKEPVYIQQVADEIDATYSHTCKAVKKLSVEHGVGYIKTKDDGRKSHLTLTEEGKDVALDFAELLRDMEEEDRVVTPVKAKA